MRYWTKRWEPIIGCDESMPCAKRCWAKRECHRLQHNPRVSDDLRDQLREAVTTEHGRPEWTGRWVVSDAAFEEPLHWLKPQTVAVCWRGDAFRPKVPYEWHLDLFGVMAEATQHTYLLLTKHPQSMVDSALLYRAEGLALDDSTPNPFQSVWFGTSISTTAEGERLIPSLLRLAVRGYHTWLSAEPLLGPVTLELSPGNRWGVHTDLAGVIVGAETGPDARPCDPDWMRAIRDQCAEYDIPFYLKQLDARGNRELDASEHNDLPWEGSER